MDDQEVEFLNKLKAMQFDFIALASKAGDQEAFRRRAAGLCNVFSAVFAASVVTQSTEKREAALQALLAGFPEVVHNVWKELDERLKGDTHA